MIKEIIEFIKQHKIPTLAVVVALIAAIVFSTVVFDSDDKKPTKTSKPASNDSQKEEDKTSYPDTEPVVNENNGEEPPAEEPVGTPAPNPAPQNPTIQTPPAGTGSSNGPSPAVTGKPISDFPEYARQLNIEDNEFMDSLIYTGYNIEKHRKDGKMWVYILASQKRGYGWLSDITYGGGCSGYETNSEGKPDIARFERGGLVCASYVSYVYFNYLPNVAGIDTSRLTKPQRSYKANDFYTAAKQWVADGYSTTIPFTAKKTASGIKFTPESDIPIGSIIAFCDEKKKSNFCSHVVVYAGYKNGYHWVFHVGNENGPEFCAVERMIFGPDPQWPISVITTPNFIYSACK